MQPMTGKEITVATETAMVQRIEQARWLAELRPQDRQSLAHLAVKYGLDPLMKEMTFYEGSPYIALAGLIRIAHRQKMFAGLEDRPMTNEERQRYAYKAPVCWIVTVWRKDWKVPATGTGTADPGNPFRNNPIEKIRPEWMARSRALRQALKLAFPHSLPFEEIESAEEFGVDPETGEIIEGMAEEVGNEMPAAEAPEATEQVLPGEFSEVPAEPEPVLQPAPLCPDCISEGKPSTITATDGHTAEEWAAMTKGVWKVPLCKRHHEGRKERARKAKAGATEQQAMAGVDEGLEGI